MKVSICGEADCPTPYEFCEACVRADERVKADAPGWRVHAMQARQECAELRRERADLRAKVEALPRPRMANDAFVMDERWDLWRAKVLALFDGGGNA